MPIRNFQIKDTQLTNCICVVEPVPRKDERGAVRSDRTSGEPLYVVHGNDGALKGWDWMHLTA